MLNGVIIVLSVAANQMIGTGTLHVAQVYWEADSPLIELKVSAITNYSFCIMIQ